MAPSPSTPTRRRTGEFWYYTACDTQNHETDGECQFCKCPGAFEEEVGS